MKNKKRVEMKKIGLFVITTLMLMSCSNSERVLSRDEIDTYWKSGKTLPYSTAKHYLPSAQKPNNDTGINVLVDVAHQCQFVSIWGDRKSVV